jgi:hypothetical protein
MTGPTDLRPLDNNPAFKIQNRGNWFFSPGKTDGRGGVFQHHHLIPNELLSWLETDSDKGKAAVAKFFNKIQQYGYDQGDPVTNGVRLPSSFEDSARLGAATHKGSHPEYTNFIRAKVLEILVGDDVSLLIGSEEIKAGTAAFAAANDNPISAWPGRPFYLNDNARSIDAREVA